MARKIPCQHCKQRRRKCERTYETEPCVRCVQMKKKCIPQDLSYKSESSEDEDCIEEFESNLELIVMKEQVQQMENELRNLELSLDRQKKLSKQEPIWNIEYNGTQLLLKSEIKTLEELMLYGQSVIRYLSPFGHSFGDTVMKFERNSPSFVKAAMGMVSQIDYADKGSSIAKISQRFSSGLVQFVQPSAVMGRLIDNYFSCINDSIPVLHEPSFREHYRSLKNPLTDPVTLAVCASASIATCRHSFFNSQEKRYVGEFFFQRAMNILTEVFDEPDRAFESLLVCNLLQVFMLITLRIRECRKWAAISVILANNLAAEYPEYTEGNDSFPESIRVKYAIIHRNAVLSGCISAIIDFLSSSRREEYVSSRTKKFDILPNEPKQTQDMISLFNHSIDLALHPVSITMITQVRNMATGKIGELNFEEIVRYEEHLLDWWHNLPEHLKICKEPFNCTADMVQSTNDLPKLLVASYLWVVVLGVQGALIHPKPKGDLESVYNVVRDRAIYLTTHAADIILVLAKKIDSLGLLCYSPAKVLTRSIDSLMVLLKHKDKVIANMARVKIREYMKELSKNISPDHQVSPTASPYSVISVVPPGSIPSVTELYKNYPLPGEALVFDIINTTVNQTTDTKAYTSYLPS